MDFQQAIEVHVAWKMKLTSYIAKPDHSLNSTAVSQDNHCELGRWLKGEGRKHAASPEFARLVADHSRFHVAAGNIVRDADSGKNVSGEVALGSKSEYAAASNAVVSAMMKMKMKVAA